MIKPSDPQELKRIVPETALEEAASGTTDSNDNAVKETTQISSGKSVEELEAEAKRREHNRDQKFRDHFEILAITSMYVMFITLCAFGLVWLLHMVLPEHCSGNKYQLSFYICRWLTSDQVTILQDIVTGGLIGGLLADHFRKRMGH